MGDSSERESLTSACIAINSEHATSIRYYRSYVFWCRFLPLQKEMIGGKKMRGEGEYVSKFNSSIDINRIEGSNIYRGAYMSNSLVTS